MTTATSSETATLADLSDDDLYRRLSIANAERAAIREVLRLRRARQQQTRHLDDGEVSQ